MNLTSDQARALFDAGGFILVSDLPESTEFGIDGTYNLTRRFSGIKFLPPGLHLITWIPPSNKDVSAGTIPIRSGHIKLYNPRERVVLKYDPSTESILSPAKENVISDDHLISLDPMLAPYPFGGWESWKKLSSEITQNVLDRIVGSEGRVDGLSTVDGQEEEKDLVEALRRMGTSSEPSKNEGLLRFTRFDIRRSWRAGAVGEEITKWSRDKSWLVAQIIEESGGDESNDLAGGMPTILHIPNTLIPVSLFGGIQTPFDAILKKDEDAVSPFSTSKTRRISSLYLSLLRTLAAQLQALPSEAFTTELPELDVFYLDQLDSLRHNLVKAQSTWDSKTQNDVRYAWEELSDVARKKYRWSIGLLEDDNNVSDEEDEEGEYAPVVVDM